jgi:hypothetical protein
MSDGGFVVQICNLEELFKSSFRDSRKKGRIVQLQAIERDHHHQRRTDVMERNQQFDYSTLDDNGFSKICTCMMSFRHSS